MSFKVNSNRYYPQQVDRAKYSIHVAHIHEGNDPNGSERFAYCAGGRKPAKYVTIARIVHRSTRTLVAYGIAIAGNRETASRAQGHAIALGRAIKSFMEHVDPFYEAFLDHKAAPILGEEAPPEPEIYSDNVLSFRAAPGLVE